MTIFTKIRHIKNLIQEEYYDRKSHICISCKYTPFTRKCNLTTRYPNGDKIYPCPLDRCTSGNYKPRSWFDVIKFIYVHYFKKTKTKAKKKQTVITTDYDWN